LAERLADRDKFTRFEEVVLPHLDAAYNLARWLMRNDHDAEDSVQDAIVRALRFFAGFRGVDGRAWLLTIVRNTCFTRLEGRRSRQTDASFDEEIHGGETFAPGPETELLNRATGDALVTALERLPEEFREVVVMRELEGLSYKEIADIVRVPVGTVMSRLARARKRLQQDLRPSADKGAT
jgi:RNA polymerase sigma factor (sigma-70 family)